MHGLDISNHNTLAYRGMAEYQAADFVIVQAIDVPLGFTGHDVVDPETFRRGYTGMQLRQAKDDGKKVGVYVWLWNGLDDQNATIDDIGERLGCIPPSVRLDMRLWLDMEDTSIDHGPARQEDVLTALSVMDHWAEVHGLPPTGIYSGDWYIRGYMDAWFPPDRVYWQANYALDEAGAVAALLPARPLIQYTSSPIDMDEMAESEIVGTPEEPADMPDCTEAEKKNADLVNALGYVAGDVLKPLTRKNAAAYVKKAVDQIRAVAEQQGISHA